MDDSFKFQEILRTQHHLDGMRLFNVFSTKSVFKLNTLAVIFQSSIELSLALVYCVGSHTQYKPLLDVHSCT